MSDVRIFQVDDGGEIEFAGSDIVTTDLKTDTGLESAVYLSWFGGNELSPWWGNIGEPVERQYTSELAKVLRDLPATSNNLLRVEDAANHDVQWMLDTKTVLDVEVSATLISEITEDLAGLGAAVGPEALPHVERAERGPHVEVLPP